MALGGGCRGWPGCVLVHALGDPVTPLAFGERQRHRSVDRLNLLPGLDRAVNQSHNLRMKSGDKSYIWQHRDWPQWRFDSKQLAL